jgi:hypothetical protein
MMPKIEAAHANVVTFLEELGAIHPTDRDSPPHGDIGRQYNSVRKSALKAALDTDVCLLGKPVDVVWTPDGGFCLASYQEIEGYAYEITVQLAQLLESDAAEPSREVSS